MIHFRLRDFAWVLVYRMLAPCFASFGKRVRLEHPRHLIGARYMHFEDGADVQNGAYLVAHPIAGSVPEVRFGRNCLVGHELHVSCIERVAIGERVLLADRVFLADNVHEYEDVTRAIADQPLRRAGPVEIGAGSWVGENACIIGCRIGRNCVIAANSVVRRDVPDYCVAAGVPARIVKRYCPDRKAWVRTKPDGDFAE
ncbi:acyltransferase [Sphingomonas sp. MS122]|uniref:acyltransferase n=1 Tax=Sphingomonas sp. MS122 TaxID=3412683 RepID=UPI003C2ADA82